MHYEGSLDAAPAAGPERRAALGAAIGFAAVTSIALIPILTHPFPPLSDYFNHLAGAYVVETIGSDPTLQKFYRIDWQIIPNLMIDLIVPMLHRFVDIYLAGQIFLALIFALIALGALTLHRTLFGAWSPLPLLALPFLYNGILLVGVVNYLFSIGLALLAISVWIGLRDRSWPWRYGVSTFSVLILFFCHLFGAGLYGLALLAFECHRLWQRRSALAPRDLGEFCAAGLPFVPILLLLLFSPTWNALGETQWEPWGKLDGLTSVVNIYYPAVAFSLVALVALPAIVAARKGYLRFHSFGWWLLGVGAVVYLAMPRELFAAYLADQRLPIAVAVMLVACADLDFSIRPVRFGFVLMMSAILALRIGEVQAVWDDLSRGPVDVLRAVNTIDRGARVLVVHDDRALYGQISDLGLAHAASLATIERSALVSTAFTVKGKHLLHVRHAFRAHVETQDRTPPSIRYFVEAAEGGTPYYFDRWPAKFDFVFILFRRYGAPNPQERHLSLAFEGRGFQLYRVKSGLAPRR